MIASHHRTGRAATAAAATKVLFVVGGGIVDGVV
jgi:hypothetical protein